MNEQEKKTKERFNNDFARTILLNRWKGSHKITLDIIFCLNNLRSFLRFVESFSYLEERSFLVLFVANTVRSWWYSPLWKNKEDYTLLSFTIRRVVYAHRPQVQAHARTHTHTSTWECARLYQIRTHTLLIYIFTYNINIYFSVSFLFLTEGKKVRSPIDRSPHNVNTYDELFAAKKEEKDWKKKD